MRSIDWILNGLLAAALLLLVARGFGGDPDPEARQARSGALRARIEAIEASSPSTASPDVIEEIGRLREAIDAIRVKITRIQESGKGADR